MQPQMEGLSGKLGGSGGTETNTATPQLGGSGGTDTNTATPQQHHSQAGLCDESASEEPTTTQPEMGGLHAVLSSTTAWPSKTVQWKQWGYKRVSQ